MKKSLDITKYYGDEHLEKTLFHRHVSCSDTRCRMRVVTICLPESYVKGVDELIGQNKYPNRSEVIRIAIRDLLVEELWGEHRQSSNIPLVAQLEQLRTLRHNLPTDEAP